MSGVMPVIKSRYETGFKKFHSSKRKNKSQKQVHDVENAYVVKDDIEYGMRNVVPLWAFGFLY